MDKERQIYQLQKENNDKLVKAIEKQTKVFESIDLIKGKEAITPKPDVDYPSIATIEKKIEEITPKKGITYFTEHEVQAIKDDILARIDAGFRQGIVDEAISGIKIEDIDYKRLEEFICKEIEKIELPEVEKPEEIDINSVVIQVLEKIPKQKEIVVDYKSIEKFCAEMIERMERSRPRQLNSAGPTTRITDMADVDPTGQAANMVLVFNGTVWEYRSYSGGGGGGSVNSIVAGTNILVDSTDPANPIVSSLSDRYKTTSTTSQAIIASGNITFTVDADLAYVTQQDVIIAYDAMNYMHGQVVGYSGTSLTVDITSKTGSGTYTSWDINLDGIAPTTPTLQSVTDAGNTIDLPDEYSAIRVRSSDGSLMKIDIAVGGSSEGVINVYKPDGLVGVSIAGENITATGFYGDGTSLTGVSHAGEGVSQFTNDAGYLTSLAGAVTSVSGTTNRITSTGGATPVIDISASYVGQTSITTLGTITTGVWSGSSIALNKIAALTASRAVVSDGSGFLASATTTATEIGYVNGVTSSIQTQLNAKEAALTFSIGFTRSTNTITANLSTGVSGGQSAIGGTASGNNLTLSSTSNATKGKILFGTSGYDEVNNRLIVGGTTSSYRFETIGTSSIADRTWAINGSIVMFLPNQTAGQFLGSMFVGDGGRSATAGAQTNLGVGPGAGFSITSGSENTIVGSTAGYYLTTAIRNVYIGTYAGVFTTTGSENLYMGYASGYNTTTGGVNTAIGGSSLRYNQTGSGNVAIGYTALYSGGAINDVNNTTGIGYSSGFNTIGTSYGVYIGMFSGYANTTGQANTIIGAYTGYNNQTGSNNTYLGFESGYGVASNSQSNNTAVGRYTLFNVTTGSYNSILGTDAGFVVTTGTGNIFAGYQAGYTTTTGGYNIIIGYAINAPTAGTSNFMSLGNLIFSTAIDGTGTTVSTGNVGIGIASSISGKLHVAAGTNTTYGTFDAISSAYAYHTYRYNGSIIGYLGQGNGLVGGGSATDFGWRAENNLLFAAGGATERMRITSTGNAGFNTTSFGSGVKVIAIGDASTNPSTNPTAGGVLYSDAGALKWRGSSGTVTTIAVA